VSADECKDNDCVSVSSESNIGPGVIVVDCVVPSENVITESSSAPLKLVANDKSIHCRRSMDSLMKPIQETNNVRRSLRSNNTNLL